MQAACISRFGLPATALALLFLGAANVQAEPIKLPDGGVVHKVDFERHLMGLLGRMGCNSGSCHGSFQGKGGLRLSLFGYNPEMDFQALSRDVQGRRINRADPDSSLLLLKAIGAVEHGGARRFARDSWAYQLFREWIRQGAEWNKGSGAIVSLNITPPEYAFTAPSQTGQLRVEAAFTDGSRENITPLCDFRTNDDAIVEVDNLGQLRSRRPGDTAVIVSYRGQVLPVRVMVPMPAPPGFQYPKVPEVSYIDREVFAKLRRLNIVPSELSSDEEFLRRVTIDTIGTLPAPKEYQEFMADSRPDKRARKIDDLLGHPMHAALWATKLSDITGNNTDQLENPQQQRPKLSQMWHDWLRKRVHDNMPYDEIVRGVLCATSRDGQPVEDWLKRVQTILEESGKGFTTSYADRPSLDLFWRRQQAVTIDQWGEKTAAAFLGVRLECAQCHKHPFDRWTQEDYRAYANIFASINYSISPESKKAIDAFNADLRKAAEGKNRNQVVAVKEVYIGQRRGDLAHPETGAILTPKALGGPEISKADKDPRVALFDWMRSSENPFFARSFANRVWGHYFGIGIVHPVDDFSLANPPSNDKLLNALARDFSGNKYDIRNLERTILNSRTYQLSARPNATNRLDRNNYSHSFIRPMMAEVVVDVLNAALGVSEKIGPEAPAGCRAIEVGSSRVANASVNYVFRIFGRPPRTSACDCERAMEPGLPQKLFLMADQTVVTKLRDGSNRLKDLLARHSDDKAALEELFIAILGRKPNDHDREAFAKYRATKPDRVTAFSDTMWALINTTEFIFNH